MARPPLPLLSYILCALIATVPQSASAAGRGLRVRRQHVEELPWVKQSNAHTAQVPAPPGNVPAPQAVPGVQPYPYDDVSGGAADPSYPAAAPVGQGLASPSRVFFLFLVYEKINNEEIWNRFFAQAVQGVNYRALVHCKSATQCQENIRSKHIFEIIPSVPTEYCVDLVTAMNALLQFALTSSSAGGPNDKFVFLSDSTLPVKPFSVVHRRLTVDNGGGSDFCVFPRSQWAHGQPMGSSTGQVSLKHHQWVVLSRDHAQRALQSSHAYRDIMQRYNLNQPGQLQNSGCLDEFWHFTALFPNLDLRATSSYLALPGFNGGPLNLGDSELQGQCDTFLQWTPRNSGYSNNMTRLGQQLSNDPGTDMSPADEMRPSSIKRLSKSALTAMRSSWFLFARKVEDDCRFSGCVSLDEAFDSLVFSDPPRELLGAEPTWAGQGEWLDNRQARVALSGVDGAIRLTWVGSGMGAKGSYCGDRISVEFSNGFKASAILTAGGSKLLWSNGVAWERAPGSR